MDIRQVAFGAFAIVGGLSARDHRTNRAHTEKQWHNAIPSAHKRGSHGDRSRFSPKSPLQLCPPSRALFTTLRSVMPPRLFYQTLTLVDRVPECRCLPTCFYCFIILWHRRRHTWPPFTALHEKCQCSQPCQARRRGQADNSAGVPPQNLSFVNGVSRLD